MTRGLQKRRCGQAGYTYLFVMFVVVMLGISSSVAAQQWKTEIRREREAELLFRGDQIRQAIALYYLTARAGFNAYPRSLNELVKDPNTSATRRYLRKLYKDPITGKEFELVKEGDYIKGVRSASTAAPVKRGNFPKEYEEFAEKSSYREWVFEYKPQGSVGGIRSKPP
ncbi:MAG: type II secretion system protein [Nitrospirae bacterium]|nr:type II secretion system protein [Nitrospirota bacterium]